jgi:hypothetical protein
MLSKTPLVPSLPKPRVFGLSDWTNWLDQRAKNLFGISGPEFEIAYDAGKLASSGVAHDVASILPLIRRLRATHPRDQDSVDP